MKKILLGILLLFGFVTYSQAQTVPLPVTVMNLNFDGTLTNTSATEAGNAKIELDADQGDDAADLWTIQSTAATNNLDFINDVTTVASLTSAGALSVTTSASVVGAEAGNSSVIIDADEGDDNADTWTLRSTASDNDLDILNHTSVALTVSPTGTVTIPAQASAPTPAAGMLYVDTTSNELCYYDGSAWQALASGTDGNCA